MEDLKDFEELLLYMLERVRAMQSGSEPAQQPPTEAAVSVQPTKTVEAVETAVSGPTPVFKPLSTRMHPDEFFESVLATPGNYSSVGLIERETRVDGVLILTRQYVNKAGNRPRQIYREEMPSTMAFLIQQKSSKPKWSHYWSRNCSFPDLEVCVIA